MKQWLVCLRWYAPLADEYLGPFRTKEGAERVRDRLERNIAARGAEEVCGAYVEPITSGADYMHFREQMLTRMDEAGFPLLPKEARQ